MKKAFSEFYKNLREESLLNEKSPPDPEIEKWVSDPKVKASFKKQYGSRWKEVLYADAWKKYNTKKGK